MRPAKMLTSLANPFVSPLGLRYDVQMEATQTVRPIGQGMIECYQKLGIVRLQRLLYGQKLPRVSLLLVGGVVAWMIWKTAVSLKSK